jgi:iron complex outermembrane receptor protein
MKRIRTAMHTFRRTVALSACLIVILGLQPILAQSAQVQGVISDAQSGEPLPGANVLLTAPGATTPITGASTDFSGHYAISGIPPGSYDLVVRFIGYQENRTEIALGDGEEAAFDIALGIEGVSLNTVVVSASRRQEKILDAPASISVLSAREISEQATISPASALRNVTGLDMAQTGADRYEIVLRGFNNAFSGKLFTLVDYRQGAVPSLAANTYSLMPISNIDTDRIEVVRGPGSALYGAGVDAGVVHIITKNPFTHPGTTVALYAGERSSSGVNLRHAGVIGENIGYKIAGVYARIDDWRLNPMDPLDFEQLDGNGDGYVLNDGATTAYQLIVDDTGAPVRVDEISATGIELPFDRAREYQGEKLNFNGMLEYRLNPKTNIILNGGYSELQQVVQTGIGTVQGIGFGYSFGQIRLQSGGFFAQAYLNRNNAGDSFVYGTNEDLIDNSTLFNTQAQYDMSFAQGRERLIVGLDFEMTTPDTEGSIYGRNEGDDRITEYGAYAQSTTKISEKVDLTAALRLDYNNVVDQFQLSPRAAMVLKPTDKHSFRVSYNRAFSSPGNNSMFLDIVAGQNPVAPGYTILARGRGPKDGFTFQHDPTYADITGGSDLVATSNLPLEGTPPDANGFTYEWNTPIPTGIDLGFVYNLVYAEIGQLSLEEINAALGISLPASLFPLLQSLLSPENTQVSGFAPGVLAKPRLEGGVDFVSTANDIVPLNQTTSQVIEIGYKGLFADKVIFAIDGYYQRQEDFVGPLLFESPIVLVPTLLDDFAAALAEGIEGNTGLAGLLRSLQAANPDLDFSPEGVAGAIADLAAGALPGPADPIGVVQPVENMDGPLGPELLLSYRNFGQIDFYGIDAAVQVMATPELSFFGSVSWVSDDFFDDEEINEPGTGKEVALNAPAFKFKGGISYNRPRGIAVNASARYTDGFPVASGPYVGSVPEYFLLDLGVGYDLCNWVDGMRFDIHVQNALNNEHRQFVGSPKLGRLTTARLTYNF